jgi:hypothetical protein
MNNKPLRSNHLQSNPLEGRNIVAEWAESLATFYATYHKIEACLQENTCRVRMGKHLSIYSQDTLVALLTSMQAELQLLFQDLDGLSPQTADNSIRLHKKLATHTKYLTQLNQQAFLLLIRQLPN